MVMMMMMTRKMATDGVERKRDVTSLPRGENGAEMAERKMPLMALEEEEGDAAVTTRK